MSDRRRIRLLRNLIATTHGRSVNKIEQLFGSHVHDLLKDLFLANHVEYDAGERVRLTLGGRNLARRVVEAKASATPPSTKRKAKVAA